MGSIKITVILIESLLAIFNFLPVKKIRTNGVPILAKFRPQITSLRKPRLYIDSASFDPYKLRENGRAIIVTRNAEEKICECVRQQLMKSTEVVVFDNGSSDATPYLAAEMGAVVVLQGQSTSENDALC